ncbi:MAG: aconitate hydratase AcnA [Thermodesulfobacteriota bacterium]
MKKEEFVRAIRVSGKEIHGYDITRLEKTGAGRISKLPFSIRVLVENLLRHLDDEIVTEADLKQIAGWRKSYEQPVEIPYHPARVLMQDFTGVPAVVDLAAMRDAVAAMGGDPRRINPVVPVDLVVDHSVQVDCFGTTDSLGKNVALEYQRNSERYTLLKWAQRSFSNFRVVPPNSGICHQVNLEHLGQVVFSENKAGREFAYPDTLVGTDSHTTMINGIGVVGWGVGGIEAEAVMLGQPYYMAIPEVIGVHMTGALREGVTATDLVLTVTQMLRQQKVVEKFVEFFGEGMRRLTITDRATIANMAPEYGATIGFFPIDEKTIDYLRMTGRKDRADIAEAYARETGLFYEPGAEPEYTKVLELCLDDIEASVAGPARPQDRIRLADLKASVDSFMGCNYKRDAAMEHVSTFHDESGSRTSRSDVCIPGKAHQVAIELDGRVVHLGDGSIVIAAITSCTNTSNPFVLIGAGLMARKAVEKGLRVPAHVKTSFAPGSKVVIDYLTESGLMPYLMALGFHPVGFGCTTCIGNSGPLRPEIETAISEKDLSVAAVLSGNRNFEARIHQFVKGNYLMSPMLVVAFALAGEIGINPHTDPLGMDPNGEPVYLRDIWPSSTEINRLTEKYVSGALFEEEYGRIFEGDRFWKELPDIRSLTFEWDPASTYIRHPPYFERMSAEPVPPGDFSGGRALLLLGDSVTTDHISPAGAIPEAYPAGRYLADKQVAPADFNSYGSRRGNHEVMMRGTFGNIRIKNQLVVPKQGSLTLKQPQREEMFIYDASMAYAREGTPLLVLGGKEYGTGSSRDWAAKGTLLLGVRAVIAESFERIHRSNLVGMGVLPLVFMEGDSWRKLGLNGGEIFSISGIKEMKPRKTVVVTAEKPDGGRIRFEAVARLDTMVEVTYFENGGILPYVLRKMMKNGMGE